jgi:prolyl-tRNA synthetase
MSEQMGITVKKKDFSEWYSQVCYKAELSDIRYNVKGFIVIRHWGARILKLMYDLYEAELEKYGHLRTYFPSLVPESNLKKEEEHIKGFVAETFWVETAGSDRKKFDEPLALRPTSETIMYPMYSLWIRSWKDMPFKRYQSCQIWRYEGKATHPFIRGREFYWIESHNCFATKREAEAQVLEDMKIADEIMYKKYGVPFMFFRRPAWDKFAGSVYTCASDAIMPDKKLLQLPSTHFLGQNFSKVFDITFENREGEKEHAWQTCYGPGISRILAAIIAVHGDDRGLVLPYHIAPIQIVIIPIYKNNNKREVIKYAKGIFSKLKKSYRVHFDDREDYSPGWKFNDWEMKGIPLRIEIGPRDMEKKQVTLVRRDIGEKTPVKAKDIVKTAKATMEKVHKNMISKVDSMVKDNIHNIKTYEDLKILFEKKSGIARVNFCSIESDGEACAERIKKQFNADVRGVRHDIKEEPKGNCIICGKKANEVVYIGKSY